MFIPALMNRDRLTVLVRNKVHEVSKTDPRYNAVMKAVASGNEDLVLESLKDKDMEENKIFFQEGKAFIKLDYVDEPIPLGDKFSRLVSALVADDVSVSNYEKFLYKLHKNPSHQVVRYLPWFVSHYGLLVLEDGTFRGFSRVGFDYLDLSGKIDCSVGKSISVQRNQVDDGPSSTVSGLVVGDQDVGDDPSDGREPSDFDRKMVVAVDPADVVAVPKDAGFIRVCRLTILEEAKSGGPVEAANKLFLGTHSDEWKRDIFDRVVEFYRLFFPTKRLLDFSVFSEDVIATRDITAVMVDEFSKGAREKFPEIAPIGPLTEKGISAALAQAVDAPKVLIELLSQVDTKR